MHFEKSSGSSGVSDIDNSLPPSGQTLSQALRSLVAILEARSIRYAIVGGIATIQHGRVRTTNDIDALLTINQVAMPSQTPGNHGSIGCNGTININAPVCGNVHYCGCTPNIGCGGCVSGKQTQIPTPICPNIPTVPCGCTNLGTVTCGGGCGSNTLTLNSGNYSCSGISLSSGGSLVINACSGPVNLYVCGSVNLNGGTVTTSGNIPNNCHINVCDSSPVNMYDGTGSCYAVINAPLSCVTMQGNTQLFGSVMADSLQTSSGTAIH